MDLAFQDLAELSLRGLRGLLERAFEGYPGALRITDDTVDGLLANQGASVLLSRVALLEGKPVAVGMVARRGRSCRIAAFGVVAEHRRKGLGRALMRRLLEESSQRGETRVWLEVLESNEAAVRLYESLGFRRYRRLVGWQAEAVEGAKGRAEEIDIEEAARRIARVSLPDAPWIVDGSAVAHAPASCRAFGLGNAAAILLPRHDGVQIRGMTISPSPTTLGQLAEVLRHAAHLWPRRPWMAAPFYPEEVLGPTMAQLGMAVGEHPQLQMVLEREAGS